VIVKIESMCEAEGNICIGVFKMPLECVLGTTSTCTWSDVDCFGVACGMIHTVHRSSKEASIRAASTYHLRC